jgi:hypothetical protein
VARAVRTARPAPPAPKTTIAADAVATATPAPAPVRLVALLRTVVDALTCARYAALAASGPHTKGVPTIEISSPSSSKDLEVVLAGCPRPLEEVAALMTAVCGGPKVRLSLLLLLLLLQPSTANALLQVCFAFIAFPSETHT